MENSNVNRSISVVIPNYNGRHLLEQNLPSVYAALHAVDCAFEVIVSDDASTDDSIAFIRENYPDVTLICNEKNGGFAININKGCKFRPCAAA